MHGLLYVLGLLGAVNAFVLMEARPGVAYESTLITTRRFCARPWRVLFGETGFSSP